LEHLRIKENLFQYIDSNRSVFVEMANNIFDNPETAFEEFRASGLLTDRLRKKGFRVESGTGTLPTAFRAVYENGRGGPSIGLLCEYDALPEIGHACAHHMQGPAILAAAESIKENAGNMPFRLVVYGTPGEEGGGGKIKMLEEGCFRDIDLALMTHGGPATQTDVKSMALSDYIVTFRGKSAHAALKPEAGRSALDGLLLSFQGIEFLREHVKEDTRMHYAVLNSGGPANVVPAEAAGAFALRSYNSPYLDEVAGRFEDVIKGAAMMSGTTAEVEKGRRLEGKVPAYKLNELLMMNAELIDAPNRKPAREKTGSTDFGNVTFEIPGAVIRVAFVADGTPSHSQEFLDAGKTEAAAGALVSAAKILAATAHDLIQDPRLIEEIKEEFFETKRRLRQAR